MKNEYEYLDSVDKRNIEQYKANSNDYYCVLCGRSMCIEDSYSNEGHRLICNKCRLRVFGFDIKMMQDWQSK